MVFPCAQHSLSRGGDILVFCIASRVRSRLAEDKPTTEVNMYKETFFLHSEVRVHSICYLYHAVNHRIAA